MADIAIYSDGLVDQSDSMIDPPLLNYYHTLITDSKIDQSSILLDGATYYRTINTDSKIDQSNSSLNHTAYRSVSTNNYIDFSDTLLNTNKYQVISSEIDIDFSYIDMKVNYAYPVYSNVVIDDSISDLQLNIYAALSADTEIDNSILQIENLYRYYLDEPPTGHLTVAVLGNDISLSNFNMSKNNTYALNGSIQWNRLSKEGSKIVFRVKYNPNDQDDLIYKDTKQGIVYKSLEKIGNTDWLEYLVQVVLRPIDFYKISITRNKKLYYSFELWDSLNENYTIQEGYFTITPQ